MSDIYVDGLCIISVKNVSHDFVRRYLFIARWCNRLDRLRKQWQWLVTSRCSVVKCFWCSLRCSRIYKLQISSWCLIGHFQCDSLEPIVGPSSLSVGIIVIVHAIADVGSKAWGGGKLPRPACRNHFFFIRTIARTSRLPASPQHILLVYEFFNAYNAYNA